MHIYAVADIHSKPERLAVIKENVGKFNPDILVVAGDITNYFNIGETVEILSMLPLPVLAVRGNTDFKKVEQLIMQHPNMIPLHLKRHSIGGINFAGLSGTVPLPFRSQVSLFERSAFQRLAPILNSDSVLVVHTPPRGVRDEVAGKFHAGSPGLSRFIEKHQPMLCLCGHIHEGHGISELGKTVVVNCAMARNSAGALIKIASDRKLDILMI